MAELAADDDHDVEVLLVVTGRLPAHVAAELPGPAPVRLDARRLLVVAGLVLAAP